MLVAKENAVVQGMFPRLFVNGKCYGMEVIVKKSEVMRVSNNISSRDYDRS
jgi:hypothetical protein